MALALNIIHGPSWFHYGASLYGHHRLVEPVANLRFIICVRLDNVKLKVFARLEWELLDGGILALLLDN